jgi:hypothetical protein
MAKRHRPDDGKKGLGGNCGAAAWGGRVGSGAGCLGSWHLGCCIFGKLPPREFCRAVRRNMRPPPISRTERNGLVRRGQGNRTVAVEDHRARGSTIALRLGFAARSRRQARASEHSVTRWITAASKWLARRASASSERTGSSRRRAGSPGATRQGSDPSPRMPRGVWANCPREAAQRGRSSFRTGRTNGPPRRGRTTGTFPPPRPLGWPSRT